jgi:hypothetical protein
MRRSFLLAALAAVAMPSVVMAQGHSHAKATPRNGGVMAEVNDIDYELVVTSDRIRLYVSDHGKPVPVANAAARVTLLRGGEKTEATLAPSGDRLEAGGSFKVGPGTRAVAIVTLPGKPPQSVRFEIR